MFLFGLDVFNFFELAGQTSQVIFDFLSLFRPLLLLVLSFLLSILIGWIIFLHHI